MEDLITDFMCEPAEMDDWLSTAATSHSGQSSSTHDPGGLVGSSQGTGFFSRGDSPRDTARHRPGRLAVLFIFLNPAFIWQSRLVSNTGNCTQNRANFAVVYQAC
jgi:hypothetical protein